MNISSADPRVTEGYAHLCPPPPACWTAEEYGTVRARVAMTEAPPDLAPAPGARMLVGLWWEPGRTDAARAVIRAGVSSLAPVEVLDLRHHSEVHPHIPDRLAMATDCGFTLFQEKQGYWWSDDGQPLPAPAHLTFRTLAEVGQDRFAHVMTAAQPGVLDRRLRAQGGAIAPLMAWYDPTADRDCWLLAEDRDGRPVGCLALSAFDEPGVGTIAHIAVLPAHRGAATSTTCCARLTSPRADAASTPSSPTSTRTTTPWLPPSSTQATAPTPGPGTYGIRPPRWPDVHGPAHVDGGHAVVARPAVASRRVRSRTDARASPVPEPGTPSRRLV